LAALIFYLAVIFLKYLNCPQFGFLPYEVRCREILPFHYQSAHLNTCGGPVHIAASLRRLKQIIILGHGFAKTLNVRCNNHLSIGVKYLKIILISFLLFLGMFIIFNFSGFLAGYGSNNSYLPKENGCMLGFSLPT
jgi:hypothetical protein